SALQTYKACHPPPPAHVACSPPHPILPAHIVCLHPLQHVEYDLHNHRHTSRIPFAAIIPCDILFSSSSKQSTISTTTRTCRMPSSIPWNELARGRVYYRGKTYQTQPSFALISAVLGSF